MNLTITDAKPITEPKPKAIVIGLVATGRIEPTNYRGDGTIGWHARVDPKGLRAVLSWIIQGHGSTPLEAVANAIVAERAKLKEQCSKLEAIEDSLGTLGLSDDQVRASAAEAIGKATR